MNRAANASTDVPTWMRLRISHGRASIFCSDSVCTHPCHIFQTQSNTSRISARVWIILDYFTRLPAMVMQSHAFISITPYAQADRKIRKRAKTRGPSRPCLAGSFWPRLPFQHAHQNARFKHEFLQRSKYCIESHRSNFVWCLRTVNSHMNSLDVRTRVCLTNGYRIRHPKVTNQKPRTISNFFKHWEESFTTDHHYSPFLYLEASGAFIWPTRTATGIQTRPQNTINKIVNLHIILISQTKKPRTLTRNTVKCTQSELWA